MYLRVPNKHDLENDFISYLTETSALSGPQIVVPSYAKQRGRHIVYN